MPTNLTGTKINDTFDQLLHVSDGPTAIEKPVYSGTGVATTLKLGTQSMSGTFSEIEFLDEEQARAALGLGTMATQSAASVEITGGTIDDVVITNALLPGITVPFNSITNRAYSIFYDLSDQTFLANTATLVKFNTTGLAVGVSVVSNTRITFAAAGVYEIACRLQFINAENVDHTADVWFRLNGTNIPYSASELVIPKSSDGGTACQAITGIVQVTAGQYLEVVVAVEDADVSLHHVAPLTTPYVRPDIPSVILVANRIA